MKKSISYYYDLKRVSTQNKDSFDNTRGEKEAGKSNAPNTKVMIVYQLWKSKPIKNTTYLSDVCIRIFEKEGGLVTRNKPSLHIGRPNEFA
jgi:hypothetical protein